MPYYLCQRYPFAWMVEESDEHFANAAWSPWPICLGMALSVRHTFPSPWLWLLLLPLALPSLVKTRTAPLQDISALTLAMMEMGRLLQSPVCGDCFWHGEELMVTVGIILFLTLPVEPLQLMGDGRLATALAFAALLAGATRTTDCGVCSLLALDLCASYMGRAQGSERTRREGGTLEWALLLAPLLVGLGLSGNTPVARWGTLPALVLSAHTSARSLCARIMPVNQGGLWMLYALSASVAIGACAMHDASLELALMSAHAASRWIAAFLVWSRRRQ